MAKIELTLRDGLPFGKGEEAALQYDATLRSLTAGDIIDARMESERVVETPSGPRLVHSPESMALHVLRRQITRIGVISGPLSIAQLRQLSHHDLQLLEGESDALEVAELSERLGNRGRAEQAPGTA
ncbi:phage tail assembly protein [Pseudomonas resinovorans]|uniref:Phage tail assembly protein n=1 Tax=Metapseudomonas resinovorans TaxID=53412 RepID=A0ABT4Y418_METRE|nr:phage tail assembly protein [Pseudomonas resinovorans]MDA8483590.1 phage tail assembly protein [Pseudomonas resinovorans]